MNIPGVERELVRGIEALDRVVRANGGYLTITSGYRSRTQQARLYRAYLRGEPGLYNVLPPGYSEHERGRAVDLVITPRWMHEPAGALWRHWRGRWGGPADPVHFGLP